MRERGRGCGGIWETSDVTHRMILDHWMYNMMNEE
jgi:hypothetical protein